MSVYHTSFNYLGINSRLKNLIITNFDADQGEVETNLAIDPVYTDSALKIRRYDYGASYNSVATFRITVTKLDYSDFSVAEIRDCLKWLTGTYNTTNLELLVGDQIKCTFTGRFTNVWQHKMDARTVGLVLEFTSTSPFAYSSKQTLTYPISESKTFQIYSPSDDLFSDVYLKTIYENQSGDTLTIENINLEETTKVNNLSVNEIITIDGPMAITSDADKKFGNSFNFVFPRMTAGINEFIVTGNGVITFEYSYPMKLGNVAVDINELIDAIDCNSNPGPGMVELEYQTWENVLNKPNTLGGYGITDAYTKTEIDNTTSEINNRIDELSVADVEWDRIINTPTTVEDYGLTDVYTKTEIDAKVFSVYKYMGTVANEAMLPTENLVVGHVYNLEDSGMNVAWNGTNWDALGPTIDLTPYLTIDEVYTKEEVDALLSSAEIEIDEDELNTMLEGILQ